MARQSDYQDESEHGVFAQSFSSAGDRVGGEFRIKAFTTGKQRFPAVAAIGAGRFVVAWQSYASQDGSAEGVFERQVTPRLFSDDFELGNLCVWSDAVGSGDGCPSLAALRDAEKATSWRELVAAGRRAPGNIHPRRPGNRAFLG